MAFIDLNLKGGIGHTSEGVWKETADEFRQDTIFAAFGLSANLRISPVRQALRRQLQGQEFFMLGPVSLHGFCPAHLPGEPARYRGLPESGAGEAVSYGHSRQSISKHFSPCQRGSRLAYLSRLHRSAHQYCQAALLRRPFWSGVGGDGLCLGFHHHRPLPVAVSLGRVSPEEGGGETAHSSGFARQYSHIGAYHSRPGSRCEYHRRSCGGSRRHICPGPGLSGFCPSLLHQPVYGLFCNKRQKQFHLQASLFPYGGQRSRSEKRSDHRASRLLRRNRLSREAAGDLFSGCHKEQAPGVFDEQFYSAGPDHCRALPLSLECGTLLQVDQRAPANKEALGALRECREDSNLDSNKHLCAGGDGQEALKSEWQPLYNSTDLKCHTIRENTHL